MREMRPLEEACLPAAAKVRHRTASSDGMGGGLVFATLACMIHSGAQWLQVLA
jgi:hypothetical protein